MRAHILDRSVWLAVPLSQAKLLQNGALGNSEGGPLTASHTVHKLAAVVPESEQVLLAVLFSTPLCGITTRSTLCTQQQELVSVRLSPEEGIFLSHAAGVLELYNDAGLCRAQVCPAYFLLRQVGQTWLKVDATW